MEDTKENFMSYLILKNLADGTITRYVIYYTIFKEAETKDSKDLEADVYRFLINHNNSKIVRAFMVNYLRFIRRRDIELPELTGRRKSRIVNILTATEIKLLAKALYEKGPKYGIMFEVSLYGGLRREELVSITAKDFNWNEWSEHKDKPGRLRVIGKGDKERIIPLPSHIMEKLRLYFLTYNPKMDEKLFKMGGSRWWTILNGVSVGAIGKKVKPHTLRHTRTTILWKSKKLDLMNIKDFLGHSSVSTTELYIHPNLEESLTQMEKHIEDEEI